MTTHARASDRRKWGIYFGGSGESSGGVDNRQADAEPQTAPHGLSQAVGASASPCPKGGRNRRFQKSLPARLDAIGREKGIKPDRVEIWFADKARVGQKNKITCRWTKRGTRPSAPQDQRTASTYIFGAICPKEGTGAALILPRCNTEGMALHLKAISAAIAPGRHAALLVDQTGWHFSAKLCVPDNITIVPLPAKCPELNPQENVWQFRLDNWLANRVFTSYDNLVDHCCDDWNKLVDQR